MYSRKIRYTDYDGNVREETFYFNFGKHELLELEWKTPGGIEKHMADIIATQNGQQLADMFKWLIDGSYGVKSPDGRSFIKNEEVLNNFKYTPAYEILYMELATDSKIGSEFINGVFPKEAVEEAKRQKEMAEKAGISLVPNNTTNSVAPVQQPAPSVPMVEGQGTIISPAPLN